MSPVYSAEMPESSIPSDMRPSRPLSRASPNNRRQAAISPGGGITGEAQAPLMRRGPSASARTGAASSPFFLARTGSFTPLRDLRRQDFGARWPWFKVTVHPLAARLVAPGDPIELRVSIANGGDGRSPATHAVAHLVQQHGGDPIGVARLRVPPLGPGTAAQIELPVRTPEHVAEGTYDLVVAVDLGGQIRQYDRTSSVGRGPNRLTVRYEPRV